MASKFRIEKSVIDGSDLFVIGGECYSGLSATCKTEAEAKWYVARQTNSWARYRIIHRPGWARSGDYLVVSRER